jgi:hypothetical protein
MHLGCADSDIIPSNYACLINPVTEPESTSRVLKLIVGLPLCQEALLPRNSTGKPFNVSVMGSSSPLSIIAQILPPLQVSPVQHSGEYFQINK